MPRLINADALFADTSFFDGGDWHYGYSAKQIDNAPTIDAVPVVRCEKCMMRRWSMGKTVWCVHWAFKTEKDGFCHWGQRREDGDA